MTDNRYYIPKHIDEPTKIFIFTLDEAGILGVTVLVSSFAGYMILGLLFAIILTLSYKKLKGREVSAFLQRYIYWNFNFSARNYIPSANQRKYKG